MRDGGSNRLREVTASRVLLISMRDPAPVCYLSRVTSRGRKLYEEALDLPVSERAELVADLLASLDGQPDEDLELVWMTEIERRARAAIADPQDDVSWEELRAELHGDPIHR